MRRMPGTPSCWWMCVHTVPMDGPAEVARASSASVEDGVRAGRSSSWIWYQPRRVRRCSRSSCAGLGRHQSHVEVIPLHLDALPEPPGRRAVIRARRLRRSR